MLSQLIVHRYFSAESGQAGITGLRNALSDHFTSFFFCNMRAKSSLAQEGNTISADIFDHFSAIRPRRALRYSEHTPVFLPDQRDL